MSNKPVPSDSIEDLKLNVLVEDAVVTSREKEHTPDRLGVERLTLYGMEKRHDRLMSGQGQRFENFLAASQGDFSGFMGQSRDEFQQFLDSSGYSGWETQYAAGIVLNSHNQGFTRCEPDGTACMFYTPLGTTPLPYTTTGDWASESSLFVARSADDVLRQDLANGSVGARIIGDKSDYPDAVYRTQHQENNDLISVRKWTGDAGVNGTDLLDGPITAAVSYCADNSLPLFWPRGTYAVADNIPRFWEVDHYGPGVLKRGDSVWKITPKRAQENVLYVLSGDSPLNDGLSPDYPISLQIAMDRLGTIGSKAAAGQWTVRVSGQINQNGVRVQPLPTFTRRLQILGDDVPGLNDVPTTVWDGGGSSLNYAFRIERNIAPSLFLLMRNIKFENWDKGAGSGAVVIWDAGSVRCENIHVDGADVGLWFNRCDAVVERGIIENCTTRGASFEYHSKFNIGRVDREYGVTIRNCGSAVQAGRQSVGYVQGCILEYNRVNINVSRLSRWRSRNNLHREWVDSAYVNSLCSVFTPDNEAGQPDIFDHSNPNAEVYVASQGSTHMHIERGGNRTVHLCSDAELIDVANMSGQAVLLNQITNNPSFVPFRIPPYAMKNQSIRLDVEILMQVSAGAAGVFALNGAGPGAATRLASCSIPSLGSSRNYKVTISLFRQPNLSSARYRVTLESVDGITYQTGTSVNANTSGVSAHLDGQYLFRLYWEPTTTANVRFYGMRTYVEY